MEQRLFLTSRCLLALAVSLWFAMAPVNTAFCADAHAASADAPAPPKIVVLNPNYDFGTAMEGQSVKHVFKVKNGGSADLVIDHVQTTCGCTAAAPSKKVLKPGDEADIAVTFDTSYEKGRKSRTITVYSNDPQTPTAAMTLQGDVAVEAEATPSDLAFNDIKHGTEQTRQVTVNFLTKNKNFRIEKISNSSPYVKVVESPLKGGKPGAVLSITMLKTMPAGSFDDTIQVTTSHRPLQIHVFGRVVGDLTLDPAQISFGIVPHGQGALRFVRLTNSGPKQVQITGVSSSNQSVAAKVDPVAAGKEYKITVELRRGTPDGQLRGSLAIKTDSPEQGTLTIPFYGIVGTFKG